MASYELIEELGRGGMGVVHRARDSASGREVALKVLLPAADGGGADTQRFKREMETLSELEHPNIIRVLECGELDGRWFYAMELIRGRSLDRVVKDGPLEIGRACKCIRQAASALAACHARGFVHRDLKPANLMLGANDHVTLMDFGLVKVHDRTVLTATGEVMGTPHYVAPELLRGEPPDRAGDVYALGVVLLELISGKPPFNADSMAQLLTEILTGGPRPLDALRPDAPAPLVELVGRMVANDPAERPTAAEVAAELERQASSARRTSKQRPRITSVSSQVPVAKPAPRVGLALGAVALAALVAGAVFRFASREQARELAALPSAASALPSAALAPPTAGARVALDPPRRARVLRSDDQDWPAGTAWSVKRGTAGIAQGRLERAARELVLTGLEPASTYALEVRAAGALSSLTFDTPRLVQGDLNLEVGAHAVAINFAQPGRETFVFSLTTEDRRVIWTQTTSEPTFFAVVRDLKPETVYFLNTRVEGANVTYQPSGRPFRTMDAQFVEMTRNKLREIGALTIIAGASDLGTPYVARLVELYPEIVATMTKSGAESETLVACLDALGEIGDPRGLAVIAGVLERNHERRVVSHALEAIGKLHRPDGFDLALRHVKYLRDDDGYELARALFGADPARAAARYRDVASDPQRFSPVDRHSAIFYLFFAHAEELVGPLVKPALARLDASTAELSYHLALMGGRVAHDALRQLVAEANARSAPALPHAVSALGRLGDPADGALIATVLATSDPGTRRLAVSALGHVGGPAAESALLGLLDDPDPHARRRAALALGRIQAKSAVDSLVARLATEPESRGRIPRALGMIGDARAVPGLTARLKRPIISRAPRDADDVDRAETVWALGILRDAAVQPVAEQALETGSDYARLRAAEALGYLGLKSALPALRKARARPGEYYAVRRAYERSIDWLEGRRPSPRKIRVVDPSDWCNGPVANLLPGEMVTIEAGGGWATAPGAPLLGSDGDQRTGERRLRLQARCRGILEHTANNHGMWVLSWNGGPVSLETEGEQPEGVGFMTCWIE